MVKTFEAEIKVLVLTTRDPSILTPPPLINVWAKERDLTIRQKYNHLSSRWLWMACAASVAGFFGVGSLGVNFAIF